MLDGDWSSDVCSSDLQESPLEEKQKYMAATAFRSSVNLLETVNDILDLSKIESGEMRLENIGFDPLYVIESTMQVLDQPASEKHLRLVRGYAGMTLPYVVGDPTRFGRVLTNLVGNAVKYTDHGQVELALTCDKVDDTHIVLRCDITDTGIGIAEDKLGAIFDKFVQADTSTTRKYGGSGLGLCITKQLVEAMGGTIAVRSKLGVGSTFSISMPFETTDRLHEEKTIRRQKMLCGVIPPHEARVLIAEDHALNQIMMKTIMERFGIVNFRMAATGMDAVTAWRHEPWDVILMDCHMPEKNGYDATIDIRRLEQERGGHVPIIAMTANAMVGDREKCLRCGMDGYISKPVDVDELQETLEIGRAHV
jgi:CheY-like chemotaxis protein